MARLSMFLPPFAADYSGAAATLFGLDCLVIIVDAGCCTRNYVEYDEPRWARRRKTAFSAQLRTLEAVMGDDSRIVEQTADAVRELGPASVAILGTPVPAVTGMDLPGIAAEVERACGVPAIGIETCGFETYEQGVARACVALERRFAKAVPTAAADAGRPRVAVWGLSPQDFLGEADMAAVLGWLDDAGLEVVCAPGARCSLGDLAAAPSAQASLALSWSGLEAARDLRARCGVPVLVGRPWCAADARLLADAVRSGLDARAETTLWNLHGACALRAPVQMAAPARLPDVAAGPASAAPLLVVGEQVAAASMRPHLEAALARAGRCRPVVSATFFSADPALAAPDDVRLANEESLLAWAREHPGFAWVGDPLLARLPGFAAAPHIELPHEAVSSTLFADRAASLAGAGALEGVLAALANL